MSEEMTPKDRPDEALDHVLYEMEMLDYTAWRVCATQPETHEHSAFLESFLIHVRALDEFVTKPNAKKRLNDDDIRPQCFVRAFEEKPVPHPEIERMHKQIAHLTFSRKRNRTGGSWDIPKTVNPIREYCTRFLEAVSGDKSLMIFGQNGDRVRGLLSVPSLFSRAALAARFSGSGTSGTISVTVAITGTML